MSSICLVDVQDFWILLFVACSYWVVSLAAVIRVVTQRVTTTTYWGELALQPSDRQQLDGGRWGRGKMRFSLPHPLSFTYQAPPR